MFVHIDIIADKIIKKTITETINQGIYRIYDGYIQAL